MRLNLCKLLTELANTEENGNVLENLDPSTDFTIFNELYMPLSKDEDVSLSQISLEKFDFDDICDFIHYLRDYEGENRRQYDWLKSIERFKPTTKQTKTFF